MGERSINQVTVLGRLGADPKIRLAGTAKYMRVSVATWTDRSGSPKSKVRWVEGWTRLDVVMNYLEAYGRRGDLVLVRGRIDTTPHRVGNGRRWRTAFIITDSMILRRAKKHGPPPPRRAQQPATAARPPRGQEAAFVDPDSGHKV